MNRFLVKSEVYYGDNAVECLKFDDIKRVFIIIDPFLKEKNIDNKVVELYRDKNVEFGYFSNIKPDPDISIIIEGVSKIIDFNPDLIIAIGGGSAIDAAKVITFFNDKINSFENPNFVTPKFAAIPTTSGTGSEVTNFSVITMDNKKFALTDDRFYPDIVVLDVEFTKTLPLPLLAETAIDALTHAIEAYASNHESDCTDALSEKAIKLLFKNLTRIFVEGDTPRARRKIHNAACIAGMAFTNASLGINHSMAHALGGVFHVSHGKANAVFLTKVLEFNAKEKYVEHKFSQLACQMGLGGATEKESVSNFIKAVEVLLNLCNLPSYVKDLDIDLDKYLENIFEMSQRALEDKCTPTNPITPTSDDLMKLFIRAYEKNS